MPRQALIPGIMLLRGNGCKGDGRREDVLELAEGNVGDKPQAEQRVEIEEKAQARLGRIQTGHVRHQPQYGKGVWRIGRWMDHQAKGLANESRDRGGEQKPDRHHVFPHRVKDGRFQNVAPEKGRHHAEQQHQAPEIPPQGQKETARPIFKKVENRGIVGDYPGEHAVDAGEEKKAEKSIKHA
ncbi:hypothetical protein DESC_40048 [Desulfosarcina cetonica]|nr:hypothetical protein DESC_40048 [Desulfosarcina cetonica]